MAGLPYVGRVRPSPPQGSPFDRRPRLNGWAGEVGPIVVRQRSLAEFGPQLPTRILVPTARPSSELAENANRTVDWVRSVGDFVVWKQQEAAVGETWIRRMKWELERFPILLERSNVKGTHLTPREVSEEMISALRTGLSWEKATFALHFAALRQFLAWAGNPIAGHKKVWSLPSGEPTHRRWLTREQFRRLYGSSTGLSRVIVALEGLNGLRRIEVLRLRAKDIALDEGCLLVLGKGRNGGKWRKVPIYPASKIVLRSALEGLGPADRVVPLSKSGADQLLSRVAQSSGLSVDGVKVSHHDLRRTFGRLAYAAGMDLIQLKNLYGHSSVEMTVHYIGLDADTMRKGLEQLSRSLGPLPK